MAVSVKRKVYKRILLSRLAIKPLSSHRPVSSQYWTSSDSNDEEKQSFLTYVSEQKNRQPFIRWRDISLFVACHRLINIYEIFLRILQSIFRSSVMYEYTRFLYATKWTFRSSFSFLACVYRALLAKNSTTSRIADVTCVSVTFSHTHTHTLYSYFTPCEMKYAPP